jgi:hypothetical protein
MTAHTRRLLPSVSSFYILLFKAVFRTALDFMLLVALEISLMMGMRDRAITTAKLDA